MEHVALPATAAPADEPTAAPSADEVAAATGQRSWASALLALLRPLHWMKNVLVVPIPLLESRSWAAADLSLMGLMVVAFILASSVVYIVNDVFDRYRDRRHPSKRMRPIASGQVSVKAAWALAAALSGALVAIVAALPLSLTWPLIAYLGLNVAYNFRLKDVALVDAFTVAVGFVLRVLQGYLVLDTLPSRWLVLAVFWSCLLLSLTRRRHELRQVGVGTEHRPALEGYSVPFLDQVATLSAGLTAATVLLYLATEAPIAQYRDAGMVVLGPATVFALFRYLQLVTVEGGGGSAVRTLLRDAPMMVIGGAWTATLLSLVLLSG